MCCTWDFSALPLPTTACLTCRAEYSCTASPLVAAPTIAAPRACPSLRAESGFRAIKTCSMANSWLKFSDQAYQALKDDLQALRHGLFTHADTTTVDILYVPTLDADNTVTGDP